MNIRFASPPAILSIQAVAARFSSTIVGLLMAGILPVAVSAGPIFIPGKLDGDSFTPGADAASACYSIRHGGS